MTEAIAVIFIFFVLVLFGLIFYAQIQRSTLAEKEAAFAGERAISASLHALFLPELRCSKGENIPVKDCVDLYKLEITQRTMADERDYYFDLFRFAKVSVKEIYPGEQEWVLYDMPKEGATRTARTPVPVSLFEPVQRTFHYGVLTIEVYS